MDNCCLCCNYSLSHCIPLAILSVPSAFRTLLDTSNGPHYSPIEKTFRTNIQILVACRADSFSVQITNTSNGTTGGTFDRMVLTKFVSTSVTANL